MLPGHSFGPSAKVTPVHLAGADLDTLRKALVGQVAVVQRAKGTEDVAVAKVTSVKAGTVSLHDGNKVPLREGRSDHRHQAATTHPLPYGPAALCGRADSRAVTTDTLGQGAQRERWCPAVGPGRRATATGPLGGVEGGHDADPSTSIHH